MTLRKFRSAAFHTGAIFSLLLCAITVWLWVKSYSAIGIADFSIDRSPRLKTTIGFWFAGGRMGIGWTRTAWDGADPTEISALPSPPKFFTEPWSSFHDEYPLSFEPVGCMTPFTVLEESQHLDIEPRVDVIDGSNPSPWHGFWWLRCRYSLKTWIVSNANELSMPCWLAAVLTSTAPMTEIHLMLRGHRRKMRSVVGCCSACRYNLTGNTSGVCPECGTPTAENRTERSVGLDS